MYQVTESVANRMYTGTSTVYAEFVAEALDMLARRPGTYLTMAAAARTGLVDALERDGAAQLGWAYYTAREVPGPNLAACECATNGGTYCPACDPEDYAETNARHRA